MKEVLIVFASNYESRNLKIESQTLNALEIVHVN